MRKLKLQVQISIDGYVAGPNGEMDWMVWNWDDKLKAYADELSAPVGTILMGQNDRWFRFTLGKRGDQA